MTLTEALGSQIIVHFTFPGDKVVTEDTKLIEAEAGGEELHIWGPRAGSAGWPRSRHGRG